VFDWGIEFPSFGGDAASGETSFLENMSTWYEVGLCHDRMIFDVTGGDFFPQAIAGWEPFFSDFPVNTGAPDVNQKEAQRPTRVLWRKAQYHNFAAPPVVSLGDDPAVPQYQHLAPRPATVNRRLRIRLDQDSGLFFYVATLNEGSFETDPLALFRTVWFKGTLYYALRF